MFPEQFLTSSPPPGTLQDANSTRAWGCRCVGRARRMAGILVLSLCAQEFGSRVTSLELVKAELQAQHQGWISCAPARPQCPPRVPWALCWALYQEGCLAGWVPTVSVLLLGSASRKLCPWIQGCKSLLGSPVLWWHEEQEDMCHPHGDPWYPANPLPLLVALVAQVQLGDSDPGLGV